jgi:hypothetical protein
MSQGDVQEYVADLGFEAYNQRLGVFSAFGTMLGGMQNGGMHAKMKSLIV